MQIIKAIQEHQPTIKIKLNPYLPSIDQGISLSWNIKLKHEN